VYKEKTRRKKKRVSQHRGKRKEISVPRNPGILWGETGQQKKEKNERKNEKKSPRREKGRGLKRTIPERELGNRQPPKSQ